jgi:hypothetical protein
MNIIENNIEKFIERNHVEIYNTYDKNNYNNETTD